MLSVPLADSYPRPITAAGVVRHWNDGGGITMRDDGESSMAEEEANQGEGASYRYFILGNITPVRLKINHLSHVVGAQVPDRSEPDGFRWSHAHWTRIEQSEEVEEVDELTFYRAVDRFLDRPER